MVSSNTDIGQRVKKLRKSKNMTQENLAEYIDVSPHYIYEIEKGLKNISVNVLIRLTVTLETSSDYLLFGWEPGEYKDEESKAGRQDRLDILTKNLPASTRERLADIVSILIPNLKEK